MALYRRGQMYYADYYANGERVQESTRTANRREAEKYLALRISEVQRGVFVRPSKISLNDFGERYMQYAQTHKRSWVRDRQMLGHLQGFFGNGTFADITTLRVEEYQQARLKDVCPATVNRELALLKHIFNLSERWGLRQGPNPVRFVRFLPEDNYRLRTLSEEEECALLVCCPAYLQDMVVFAINTGLRCGDLFNLKWEEVDLETKRLNVIMGKTQRPLEVPLNDVACNTLRAWEGMKKCPFVFYNLATGDRFYDVKAGLKKAVEDAGLKEVSWHTFRHTFASRLTRNGVDLVTVKELMGHSTITVTMRYAHTNQETKERAVKSASGSDKPVTVIPRKRKNRQ
jgi:integrase